MTIRKPLIGLVVFLLISAGLTWPVVVTLQRGVQGSTSAYSAVFSDVSGLRVGDDVRMAGVRVGRVDSISLDDTVARVSFSIDSTQQVFVNTEASITYQNIIGQRYLGLSLGENPDTAILEAGSEIPLDRTEPSFDISVLLNGFEPLFSVLDPEQVDNITASVIAALQGDGGSVSTLVAETSRLAESMTEPDRILGDIIVNLDGIISDLAAQSGEIDSVITSAHSIFAELNARRPELVGSLDTIATTADSLASLTGEVQPDLQEMLRRQPGFTGHFVDTKPSWEYFGFNLPGLLKGLARVSEDGSYLNAYLCNINATLVPELSHVIPSIVAGATPGGETENSPICR
jgi:phospholipid/cholesterol/gamma-HCH transport system substrate-binding protein